MKSVQFFCPRCEELLCVDCFKAHIGGGLTKDHKVITFAELQQSKRQEIDEHIKLVTDEERKMDIKCTSNRELIENIMQAEVRQMAEVDRLRHDILDEVNRHHNSLLSKIQLINQNTITSLEQQGQLFTDARQQLADKKQFLADVSQSNNIAVLTDTLKNLNSHLHEEMTAIKLPKFDRSLNSSVQVVKGSKWDPGTSTRIEVPTTAAVGESESRIHTQNHRRHQSFDEEAGTASAGRLSRRLSSDSRVRNTAARRTAFALL